MVSLWKICFIEEFTLHYGNSLKKLYQFQMIAKSIRDLLEIEEPDWTRSISLPPRSDLGKTTSSKYGFVFY